MSGPKYIETKRPISVEDIIRIHRVVEKVVDNYSYKIVKQTRQNDKNLKVEAQNKLTMEKIQIESKLDEEKIDLNIENEEECQQILEDIVNSLSDIVKDSGSKGKHWNSDENTKRKSNTTHKAKVR